MRLESTTISINLKIKSNVEYTDKKKINMKYLKYKLFYSLPFRKEKLVQFREKYDKQKTHMCFKFTAISNKILNKKPNMEYIDKNK